MVRPFYHVGVLCFDIEAAKRRFSEILGTSFSKTITLERQDWEEVGRGIVPGRITFSWSRLGPPYFELIEAQGDGVWSREQGEGLHHVAFHVDDVPGWIAAAGNQGLDREASRVDARELPPLVSAYLAPPTTHGVRLEVVSIERKAQLERFLETDEWQ